MTVSEDHDEHQTQRLSTKNDTMMPDISAGSTNSASSDAPTTPPSASKGHPMLSSSNHGPPECPRHERPINRRLFLQEAQDRLSLPDLFAPRAPAPSRRARTSRMFVPRPQPSNSGNLTIINPRAAQWGEYFDGQGHSMSQRSVYGNNPAIL